MLKLFVAFVLLISVAVLSGCASMEGYHQDSDSYNQPSGYSGGHNGHGGHSH